jgi:hypothetical protein
MRVHFALPLFAAALAGCTVLPEGASEKSRATRTDTNSGYYSSPVVQPLPGPATVQRLPAPRSEAAGQCLSRLGQTGADYAPLPDRYIEQGCTNLGTVQLAALAADHSTLAVSNLGPVTCEVSQVFAAWARFGVDRAARQILGSGLYSIETFGSYSCRNVAGTDRRSGHATGAAIDVSGFVLEDGRRITVTNGWHGNDREREFLRVVRQSACKRFATVLSPDYNSAHHDHLHVEGVIDGSSSYCR